MAATKEQLRPFFKAIYEKSDKVVEGLLIGYFVLGIAISFVYDTWLVGFGVGTLNLLLYFGTKFTFKNKDYNQYAASLVLGLFMAQFIYQMHGMFEMHFTVFIALIALIAYQNKWAFIPVVVFVVVHHSAFAYIQYLGYVNDIDSYKAIYFTQLDYMDFQTFVFHAGLFAVGAVLSAIYAHNLKSSTVSSSENILKLQDSEKITVKNIDFANEISTGNFDYEFQLVEGDQLGSALVEMRDNLKQSAIREKQEKFINRGLAEVGDIIRNNSSDLENLAYEVVTYLVKYMKLNQGGMFVLEEDGSEQYLELKGCYAYDRKKFLEKKVEIGEGLVGQCYLERETIYLKEIPQDYINITSGLGEARPDSVLIVPIKNDQITEGIMEFASFRAFEEFEIQFLEKIGENIASAINAAKTNIKTKQLYEQSQQQAEEMRAQEEEMRQNMEELSATQEEMQRKSVEFESRLSAIDESGIATIEFDTSGNVLDTNESFCQLMGVSKEEVKEKDFDTLMSSFGKNDLSWEDILAEKRKKGIYSRKTRNGKSIKTLESYVYEGSGSGSLERIYAFITDVTEINEVVHQLINNGSSKATNGAGKKTVSDPDKV